MNRSKNPVQLVKVEYSDDVDTSTLSSENPDDSLSSLRATPGRRYDESSIASRESSISGDSSRGIASKSSFSPNLSSKSEVVMRRGRNQSNYPAVASTSSMMSPRENEKRKVSHDVSAFRARQVRSEIFADNFNPGRLNRPKSLDNLNKIGGFRGSNDTLSSGSAVESSPNRNSRGHARISPPSSPINAFRVIPQQNSRPYSPPITSKRGTSSRSSSPPTDKSPVVPRRMRASPQPSPANDRNIESPQYSQGSARDQSTPPRSRRSSFSSAISGHESDQELERIDNVSVSSKRSSLAERTPPPYPRDARDESASKSKRSSIAERGPPPPYQRRPGQDVEKREDSSSPSKRPSTAERRPPPYPRGPEMEFQPEREHPSSPYPLNRSASFHSRSGVTREEQSPLTRASKRESFREKKTASLESPSREQVPRHSPFQKPPRRNEAIHYTKDSPNAKNYDSSVDSETEVLIDATESVVSAVPISPTSSISPSNNVVSPSDNNSSVVKVAAYFRQNESLQESPLRRMNSMPRYNARSRNIDESSPLKTRRDPLKGKSEAIFGAVMVRQESVTEEPLFSSETRSSDAASGGNSVVRARVTSFEQQKPEPTPKSSTLTNLPVQGSTIRNDDDEDDRWSKISSGTDNSSRLRRPQPGAPSPNSQPQRDDSGSEELPNSRNSSRASQRDRKGTTHQWLEYGCV